MVTKVYSNVQGVLFSNSLSLDLDPEEEKEEQKALEVKFEPLIEWLKHEAKDSVLNGTDFETFLSLLLNVFKSCDFQPPCQEPLCHCRGCRRVYCQCGKDNE